MRFKYKLKQTDTLNDAEFEEIVTLQQSTFNIPADFIIKSIKRRHYILVYRGQDKLIGTVGMDS